MPGALNSCPAPRKQAHTAAKLSSKGLTASSRSASHLAPPPSASDPWRASVCTRPRWWQLTERPSWKELGLKSSPDVPPAQRWVSLNRLPPHHHTTTPLAPTQGSKQRTHGAESHIQPLEIRRPLPASGSKPPPSFPLASTGSKSGSYLITQFIFHSQHKLL